VFRRVTALDADTSLNGEINYAIMPTSSEPPPFRVMSNGTIFTSIYLDRETTPKYTFSVMASDKGTPTRSSTAVVIVNVLDENILHFVGFVDFRRLLQLELTRKFQCVTDQVVTSLKTVLYNCLKQNCVKYQNHSCSIKFGC
jgi:hypothetical protein